MINTDLHNTAVGLKKDFIETIKHELKTPVLAQIRVLELLLSGHFGKLKFEQSEILKSTLNSCEYMYKIISDIIYTYKFENNDSETVLFAQKIKNNKNDCCLYLIKEDF